tara:strand:- start:122 stop:343 length:222 start_codon:yes stop_codon:yes gene_type:complete
MTRKLRIIITWELDCEPEEYDKALKEHDLPSVIEYAIPDDYNTEMIDDYDLCEELSETHGFLISELQVVVVND